jgi:hypothetical protein
VRSGRRYVESTWIISFEIYYGVGLNLLIHSARNSIVT